MTAQPKQHHLPTTSLQPNPFQPREKIKSDEIQDLIISIKSHGILEPIVVAHTPAGYQIIAGERRWRAARELGLAEVPVVVRETTPRGMLEMAIIENIQRVDLNPLERAQGFYKLFSEFRYTQSELSEKLGKSVSYVSNTIKLLDLPDAVKDGLISGSISEGHARAIVSLENEKDQIDVYKRVLKQNLNVRTTEDIVRRLKQLNGQVENRGRAPIQMSAEFDKMAEELAQAFTHAKEVRLTRSRARTQVTIVLKGSIEETQKDLEKILSIAKKK